MVLAGQSRARHKARRGFVAAVVVVQGLGGQEGTPQGKEGCCGGGGRAKGEGGHATRPRRVWLVVGGARAGGKGRPATRMVSNA